MTINAAEVLNKATIRHGVRLELLIAEIGLWAHPEVHRRLCSFGGPAFYPNYRRCRRDEKRGQTIGTVTLDDNSYANSAIKQAIGIERQNLVGFETCHIWPRSCYDERYHTAPANLVLLPRAIAGLSDHDLNVQLALQYRAFELYGWWPENQSAPMRPENYPTNWRPPMPFTHAVEHTLRKRIQAGGEETSSISQMPHGRDYTKYDVVVDQTRFPNCSKRKAMLTLIRSLIDLNISPADIASTIPCVTPDRLFRSLDGRFNSAEFKQKISQKQGGSPFDPLRWFCDDDQILYFGGSSFVLTNQWGDGTAEAISSLLRRFPDYGISIAFSTSAGQG